jgi:hypothetical protein
MKAGPRVVKGRTVKQRAAARRYSTTAIAPTIPSPAALMPASSWWIGVDRAQLQQRAAAERPRIQASRFGRVVDPTYTEGK